MQRKSFIYSEGDINIEYSIVGKGEPILVFHGGHSNSKEEFGYQALVDNGYSIITPSRPGYGKTSKEMGESLSTANYYYKKLLEHLRIEKVHVIGISAGGPTEIYFTAYAPNSVRSLILQSAVTKEWLTGKDKEYKAAHVIFRPATEKFTWKLLSTMNNLFPRFIFRQMFSQFSSLPYSEAIKKIEPEDIEAVRQMNRRQRSGAGFLLDLNQVNDLSVDDLRAVECPTLIMHSQNDGSVPLEHALFAHENIASSKLEVLDSWGHLIWLGQSKEDVDQTVIQFLSKQEG